MNMRLEIKISSAVDAIAGIGLSTTAAVPATPYNAVVEQSISRSVANAYISIWCSCNSLPNAIGTSTTYVNGINYWLACWGTGTSLAANACTIMTRAITPTGFFAAGNTSSYTSMSGLITI